MLVKQKDKQEGLTVFFITTSEAMVLWHFLRIYLFVFADLFMMILACCFETFSAGRWF